MTSRFMRTIIFFDLPTSTKSERRTYNRFIKQLKKNGFSMLQESVYTKLSMNETVVSSTMKEIKKNLPSSGFVSALTLTEKQYSSIEHLVGFSDSDLISSNEKIVKL